VTESDSPVSLRYHPPVGAAWKCRVRTRVEVREPDTGDLQVSEGEMLCSERILRAAQGGLVKQTKVLASPQEPDLCQGTYEALCSPEGGQLLALGQQSPLPPCPALFPPHPVAVGQSWPIEATLDLPMRGTSQVLPARLRLRGAGRLVGLREGAAQLEIGTESRVEGPGPTCHGTQEMKLLVNLATGVCMQSETRDRQEIRLYPAMAPLVVTTVSRMDNTWDGIASPRPPR